MVSMEKTKRQPEERERWDQVKDGHYLTFRGLRVRVTEHLILVTKHVVVDVEFVCNGSLKEQKHESNTFDCVSTLAVRKHQEIIHHDFTQAYKERWSTNLGCQHKGLHELPHGLHVVGQLAHHLHHHALVQGGVSVHVPNLGVTIPETQSHHPLMNLLKKEDVEVE